LLLEAESCELSASDKALVDRTSVDTLTAEVDDVNALYESKTLATQVISPPGNGDEPKAASDRPLTTLNEEVGGSIYENSYETGRSSSLHCHVEYIKRVWRAVPPVAGTTEKDPNEGGVLIITATDARVVPAASVKIYGLDLPTRELPRRTRLKDDAAALGNG
jgi:hypothetical protein